MATDKDYMALALALAEKGRGTTSPNPMVGAVIVKDGQIVGRGWHERAGGPHAEVAAIAEAGEKARGADIFVTLEPCNHHGKTGPCSEAVIAAGIKRVVAAMRDPNPVAKGGLERLAEAGIETGCGLLEAEARRLNEAFLTVVEKKRPFVILKAAATLDGRTATRTGDSKWITGPESRAHAHTVRRSADVILVGVGTVLADDPELTARVPGLPAKNPVRALLDTNLRTPAASTLLRTISESAIWLFCGPDAPSEKRAALEKAGARVFPVALNAAGSLDVGSVMTIFNEFRVQSVLVEGGSHVHASFLKTGPVDKAMLYFAPKILGGSDGRPMFPGTGPEKIAEARNLTDITVHRFGQDLMVEGYFS